MNDRDFEITLGNAIDMDIDVWEEDHKEPEQVEMFDDEI